MREDEIKGKKAPADSSREVETRWREGILEDLAGSIWSDGFDWEVDIGIQSHHCRGKSAFALDSSSFRSISKSYWPLFLFRLPESYCHRFWIEGREYDC